MIKHFLLLLALVFATLPTLAASIEILRDLRLPERDGSQHWIELHFEETNPGRPMENRLMPGCDLQIYSDNTVLQKGTYQITRDDLTRPSMWDRRTWRLLTSTQQNSEVIVACKSHGRISNRYINKVLANYARVK